MNNITFNLNNFKIGNDLPFALIAGPCQLESRAHALETATALKEMCDKLSIPLSTNLPLIKPTAQVCPESAAWD